MTENSGIKCHPWVELTLEERKYIKPMVKTCTSCRKLSRIPYFRHNSVKDCDYECPYCFEEVDIVYFCKICNGIKRKLDKNKEI